MQKITRQFAVQDNKNNKQQTHKRSRRQKTGRKVLVQHDNVQKAIRKLRRLMVEQKIFEDYKKHLYHTKPSKLNRKKKNLKLFKARLWSNQLNHKMETTG